MGDSPPQRGAEGQVVRTRLSPQVTGGAVSLIPSLIQLRSFGFTWPLSAVPPQVADDDPR